LNDKNAKAAVQAMQELTLKVHEHFQKYDHTKIIKLHEKVVKDEALKEEFIKDPKNFIEKETGIPTYVTMDDGKTIGHYHLVDENNNYIPAEGPEETRSMFGEGNDTWSRLEIRLGSVQGSAFSVCYFCPFVCS